MGISSVGRTSVRRLPISPPSLRPASLMPDVVTAPMATGDTVSLCSDCSPAALTNDCSPNALFWPGAAKPAN
ncbi:hypothetical protein X977_1267 [Burkholderia pseudomallei MSHR7504]|nr:hypothetical protein X977_1267 [Burkholderia pseudomallei MSHR7504]